MCGYVYAVHSFLSTNTIPVLETYCGRLGILSAVRSNTLKEEVMCYLVLCEVSLLASRPGRAYFMGFIGSCMSMCS
jgi:hypothetical protein